jgi:hypothetical protein
MTHEEVDALAELLTPDQKIKLIALLWGPDEGWDEAACEFVNRLYGFDPKLDYLVARDMIKNIVQEQRDRGGSVNPDLLLLLKDLEKRAGDANAPE